VKIVTPSSALRAPSPVQTTGEGKVASLLPRIWREKVAEDRMRAFAAAYVLILLTLPAHAVKPDEILQDPVLEARAREISFGLRCLVCQNQSIDDSDATVARDLRILIREQLQQKKSDEEVVDFVVARYGEYVLLKPRFKSSTLVLWATPFLILLAGVLFAFRRKSAPVTDMLSEAEKAEIEAILRK
jgi:cytochrome c-type biogenesis protein CcmH